MKGLAIGFILYVVSSALPEDEVCPRRHHALLIAFLPLHRGETCRELVQKGVQQRVALETAVDEINSDNELPIGLKILDTCSNTVKATEAALRGIGFAERRCSKFPVFLGFLGPDDDQSLYTLVEVLNYTHVIPGAPKSFQQFNAINVETIDPEERGQRIAAFLKYLKWHSFILVFTSDRVSSRIATVLLESDIFCVANSVLRIPSYASNGRDRAAINKLRRTVEQVQTPRVVLVTDDPHVMNSFTDYVEDDWGDFECVLYTTGSGVLPWKSSMKLFRNSVILHEVPRSPITLQNFDETLRNSSLWASYTSSGADMPKVVLEPSVVPYVYSVRLYSRALKTVTRMKCGLNLMCDALKAMTQAEWRKVLEDSITAVNTTKIRFYMTLDRSIDVIVYDENETYAVVGAIGSQVSIYRPEALKRSNRSRTKQCMVDAYEYELEPDPTTAKVEATTASVPGEEKVPLYFGYYELMATVIGFPVALIVLIGITIVCVCRNLRDDSDGHSKLKSSVETNAEDYN